MRLVPGCWLCRVARADRAASAGCACPASARPCTPLSPRSPLAERLQDGPRAAHRRRCAQVRPGERSVYSNRDAVKGDGGACAARQGARPRTAASVASARCRYGSDRRSPEERVVFKASVAAWRAAQSEQRSALDFLMVRHHFDRGRGTMQQQQQPQQPASTTSRNVGRNGRGRIRAARLRRAPNPFGKKIKRRRRRTRV